MQGKLYTIMEICRMFDSIYKEHLDGVYVPNNIFHSHFLRVLFAMPTPL
jgi:hypothetical protein